MAIDDSDPIQTGMVMTIAVSATIKMRSKLGRPRPATLSLVILTSKILNLLSRSFHTWWQGHKQTQALQS